MRLYNVQYQSIYNLDMKLCVITTQLRNNAYRLYLQAIVYAY